MSYEELSILWENMLECNINFLILSLSLTKPKCIFLLFLLKDKPFAAWCPSNLTVENWYEVSFDGPHNVTGLRVQVPVNNVSTHDPYLTEFYVFLEHVSDDLGSLQLFQHPGNDSVSYLWEFKRC